LEETVYNQILKYRNFGSDVPATKRVWYSRYLLPTDSNRTRPSSYTVARAVSPRSQTETMPNQTRNPSKRTGYCNQRHTRKVGR